MKEEKLSAGGRRVSTILTQQVQLSATATGPTFCEVRAVLVLLVYSSFFSLVIVVIAISGHGESLQILGSG